ncbi:hypothetical protein AXF42_Ash020110 [Apostasia shenzhenica]|uniref:Uncharacterized protein n=1 Tax=Apostasia shenzhenica TaxID=1088818 RepID=A0A2I0A3P3_9ASPA|nr:hypothetical protein AXF42_Ash020110 [Apostasia shenzhenica]
MMKIGFYWPPTNERNAQVLALSLCTETPFVSNHALPASLHLLAKTNGGLSLVDFLSRPTTISIKDTVEDSDSSVGGRGKHEDVICKQKVGDKGPMCCSSDPQQVISILVLVNEEGK